MPHAKKKALVPSYTSTLYRSGGGWVEGGGGGGVPPYFLHREGGPKGSDVIYERPFTLAS